MSRVGRPPLVLLLACSRSKQATQTDQTGSSARQGSDGKTLEPASARLGVWPVGSIRIRGIGQTTRIARRECCPGGL